MVNTKLFKSLFKGRQDCYGEENTCIKENLTDNVIIQHLEGQRRIGVYMLLTDSAYFACIDIDRLDNDSLAIKDTKEILKISQNYGLTPCIERSKSKGYHLWLFFSELVQASKVRTILKHIHSDSGIEKIEIFPKQDRINAYDQYGNFVNLPLFRKDLPFKTAFLDPINWNPYLNQWQFLSKIKRISPQEIDDIIKAKNISVNPEPYEKKQSQGTPLKHTESEKDFIIKSELDKAINKAVVGNRNDTGYALAIQLRDNRIEYAEAEQAMREYQSMVPQSSDVYDWTEAENSLISAYNHEARDPSYQKRINPNGNHSSIDKSSKGVDPVTTEIKEAEPVQEKLIMPFRLTDYGNAERLVYYHGENIRYCEAMKSWFIWDGKRWKADDCLEIERLAKDTVRRIYNEAGNSDNENQRKAIADHAKRSEANNKIQAMVSLARSESGVIIRPNDLDRDGFLLNCENGTIDLRTGELLPHRKTDNITKIIPVNYDKTAECSRWELFLKEIFKDDKDLITFIKYAVGYSLTGSIKEECIFICYGTGRNGKSKLLDTLEFLFGDYGRNVDPSTFEDMKKPGGSASEDIARLKDARFISTIETAEGRRLAENLIKKMTGDRIITARELYQKSFQFEQAYKIWLATNHKPIIRGTDNAIWERIKLIPFEVYFSEEKRDKDLLEKLIAEAPGILNWALEGCLLWQGMGLYPVTAGKVKDATNDYRTEMDLIGEFIKDKCIQKVDVTVSKQFLYNAYSEWCKESGIIPESKIRFGRRLKESYNIIDDSGADNISIWKGLGLKYIQSESK